MKNYIVFMQKDASDLNFVHSLLRKQVKNDAIILNSTAMNSLNCFAPDLDTTLFCVIPVLYAGLLSSKEKIWQWTKFSEDDLSEYKDDFEKTVLRASQSRIISESASHEDWLYVSRTLHRLFDDLHCSGSCKLRIYIDSQLTGDWYLESPIYAHLSGALARAAIWHMATFQTFNDSFDSTPIDDLTASLDIDIWVPRNNDDYHLWSGMVTFDCGKSFTGIAALSVQLKLNSGSSSNYINDVGSNRTFSPYLEMVSACDCTCLPVHLLDKDNQINVLFDQQVSQWLLNEQHISSVTGMIFKLGYSYLYRQHRSKLSYEKWKKVIVEGEEELPYLTPEIVPKFSKPDKYVHFLLTVNCGRFVFYPFREMDSFNIEAIVSRPAVDCTTSDRASPVLTDADWSQLGKGPKILSFRELLAKKKEEQQTLILQTLVEKFGTLNIEDMMMSQYMCDSNDWYERRYLFEKQLEEKKAKEEFDKQCPSRNEETNVKAINCDVRDILALFCKDGRVRHPRALEPLDVKPVRCKPSISINDVKDLDFDAALKLICHDVYYNNSEAAESNEQSCHQNKDLLIRNQTGSTVDGRTLNKAYQQLKSKSLKRAYSDDSASENIPAPQLRRSPRKKLFQTAVRRLSPRKRYAENTEKLNRFRSLLGSSDTESLDSFPASDRASSPWSTLSSPVLRRSPRKKLHMAPSPKRQKTQRSPVKRSSPVKIRRLSTNSSSSNPYSNMDEKLRLKLRVAVADALEAEGIDLHHPMFKACGRKLFSICKTFADDLKGAKKVAQMLRKVADSHVKQVIEFEKLKQQNAV